MLISTSVVSLSDGLPPSFAVTVSKYADTDSLSSAAIVVIAPVWGLIANGSLVPKLFNDSSFKKYVICALIPTSLSVADTTKTVVPIGTSSNTLVEYGAFSKTGAKLFASVMLILTVAVSVRPPESLAVIVKMNRFSCL